jgi:hypothetical protein
MTENSDEDLLAAINTDPDALPAFYLRHIAKVTGMGVRQFDQPEDVADFVANVFLEVCAPRVASTQAGDMPWPGYMDWEATSRRPCTASTRARSGQSSSCRAARFWMRMTTPAWRNVSTRPRTSAVPIPRCND